MRDGELINLILAQHKYFQTKAQTNVPLTGTVFPQQ